MPSSRSISSSISVVSIPAARAAASAVLLPAPMKPMKTIAGPPTAQPLKSMRCLYDSTAAWLARYTSAPERAELVPTDTMRPASSTAVITEYDYPVPQDLPHDLRVIAIDSASNAHPSIPWRENTAWAATPRHSLKPQ